MRENKFRSWDERENKFYYFKKGKYYKDIDCKFTISERICKEFSWENAEQFTGAKDKNGVDIYEGDKVKVWIYQDDGKPLFYTGKINGKLRTSWEIFWNNYENAFRVFGYPSTPLRHFELEVMEATK